MPDVVEPEKIKWLWWVVGAIGGGVWTTFISGVSVGIYKTKTEARFRRLEEAQQEIRSSVLNSQKSFENSVSILNSSFTKLEKTLSAAIESAADKLKSCLYDASDGGKPYFVLVSDYKDERKRCQDILHRRIDKVEAKLSGGTK